jgi:hypothetical protein
MTKERETSDADTMTTISLREWLSRDRRGAMWVIGCIVMGALLGFVAGAGWLEFSSDVKPWRQDLSERLQTTTTYRVMTLQGNFWEDFQIRFSDWCASLERDIEVELYATNPSHPRVFAVLREAVIREKGGYVHPGLGFLVPAPSGAARGIGMVRDSYHKCQVQCVPGLADEKLQVQKERLSFLAKNETYPIPREAIYRQEEILLRIPLKFQMTRSVALETLLPIIPAEVQREAGLAELDDAALLVLLLAHERGVGRYSRWMAYMASLPPEPSCGYSKNLRPYMLDAMAALRDELGVHTQGWSEELLRAQHYAQKVAEALSKDYGQYIKSPPGKTNTENIAWALCQVASRATAGSEKYGSLRLVPMVDQINHDANAAGFTELTGKERLESGDFLDAKEEDNGMFVVRSLRHGRRKPLKKGQELLANYNVPHYAPLDWFVSVGFVPPERQTPWQKVDPVLPRVRRDGPFAEEPIPTAQVWKQKDPAILNQLKNTEL